MTPRELNRVIFFWHCNTFWSDKAGSILRLHLWLSYRKDKQRRSQRPWNGYHNLSLQWVIVMTYSFHKHSNWYCYNHFEWYRCGHYNQYRYIHHKISCYSEMQHNEQSLRDVINPLVSLLYLENQRPNHRPLPMLSVRLFGRQPMIKGRPRYPSFHLIELSLSDVIVANITIDNATIITMQINQVTFDMVGYWM